MLNSQTYTNITVYFILSSGLTVEWKHDMFHCLDCYAIICCTISGFFNF